MNINDFIVRYQSLRDTDIITDVTKCDHPECKGMLRPLKKVVIKRNILKNGGKEFICRDCMMTHRNPMNQIGENRQTDEIITVACPDARHEGPRERQMKKSCYFGTTELPYQQVCRSCSQRGKTFLPETRAKISESLTGRTLSEETKEKMSIHMRNRDEESVQKSLKNLIYGLGAGWNKGLTTPDEVKQKISQANAGKVRTPEQRENISIGRKNMLQATGGFTDEHRENIRKATINQYLNGFDPNLYHLSGWHNSSKCIKPAFFRSSYEKKAYELIDADSNISSYTTEGWHVTYHHPFKNKECTYIVDLSLKMADGSIVHVEVKPQSLVSNLVVKKKAEAAVLKATLEGCSYELWTETKLFGSNDSKIIAEFCANLQNQLPDSEERRKKSLISYRARAKRHYDKVIAPDKVAVHCDYCHEEHQVLRVNYDKNVAKNGRYICGKEGGHIAGSLKKPHLQKENPYAADGKKQCTQCQQVLPFDDFGNDKSRSDGKANRCKKCRNG